MRWYYIPGTRSILVANKEYGGYWFARENSIVLAGDAVLDGRLVRHEMLHAIVGGTHAREFFADSCGGIVSCEDVCATETNGPTLPSVDAPEVDQSALTVALDVQRTSSDVAVDSGWITLTVSVRAQASQGVWAQLTPVSPSSKYSATFGFVLDCVSDCSSTTGSEYVYEEGTRFGIAGGKSRMFTFDKRLSTGIYSVRGTFNTDTTPPIQIKVF